MTGQTAKQAVRPVAGPTFRAVARMRPGGEKRRKVLALAAGFRDGGAETVTVGQLAHHLGWRWIQVSALVGRLVDDGYLVQTRAKSKKRGARYAVVLPGEGS